MEANCRGAMGLTAVLLGFAVAGQTVAEEVGPRNVVLFVGDGMGLSTVTAARILDGQNNGLAGEEHLLSFEHFPNVALIKTYNTDAQVPDSAGTMTALVTGYRTRAGVLSIGPEAARGDCEAGLNHQLTTLLEEAEQRGYGTGLVSTARITHATPAAAYAHSPDRGWELPGTLPEGARGKCADIARQLIEFPYGDGVDLVLGGGRAMFLPTTAPDPEDPGGTGRRRDGRNLVEEWLAVAEDRRFVHDSAGFKALDPTGGQVLGLFEASHMEFEADRADDTGGEPSLAEMTRHAISTLEGTPGYFPHRRGRTN